MFLEEMIEKYVREEMRESFYEEVVAKWDKEHQNDTLADYFEELNEIKDSIPEDETDVIVKDLIVAYIKDMIITELHMI